MPIPYPIITQNAPPSHGFVYFVESVDTGFVKIGRARNVPRRMTSYLAGSPSKMRLLHAIKTDDYTFLEHAMHCFFNKKQKEREWFILDDYDKDVIQHLPDIDFGAEETGVGVVSKLSRWLRTNAPGKVPAFPQDFISLDLKSSISYYSNRGRKNKMPSARAVKRPAPKPAGKVSKKTDAVVLPVAKAVVTKTAHHQKFPMNIDSADPLPIPPKLAALRPVSIPPYGPLVTNRDVAEAFGVKASTLRTWRSKGAFPEAAYSTPTQSFYRVADLISPYYQKNPGARPDPPLEEMGAFLLAHGREQWEADQALSRNGEAVSGRLDPALQSDLLRAEMVKIVAEAVERLVEAQPESPAVIETLAAEIAAQRKDIETQRTEIERLRAEAAEALSKEAEASQWRSKSFWDRVLKR